MILVTGASGMIGNRLVRRLLEDNQDIRVVSRSEEKVEDFKARGAQTAIGDLLDLEFVKKAFDGCDQAFLMVQGNVRNGKHSEEELHVGKNYAEVLKTSGIKHAVFSGSLGAKSNTGTDIIDIKGSIEDELEKTGIPVTVLRPGVFFENMFGFLETLSSGFFTYPMKGTVKIPHVSVEDIALIAYRSLKRGANGFEIFDLPGADDYCMLDIAGEISEELDRMIKYSRTSDEQFIEVFTGFGISEEFCQDMLSMFRFFERAEFKFDREKVQKEFDYIPLTLKEFVPILVKSIK